MATTPRILPMFTVGDNLATTVSERETIIYDVILNLKNLMFTKFVRALGVNHLIVTLFVDWFLQAFTVVSNHSKEQF